ncbi:UNVERIFIED_CONTAM: hypothetical protein RMT77_008025 [Armadillidium vulgare]
MIKQLLIRTVVISVVITTQWSPTECQIFPPLRMAMETGSKIMGFLKLPSLDQLNPFKRETPKIQSYKYVPPPIQSLDQYSPAHDIPPSHHSHIISHGIPKQHPGENIHKTPPHSFGGPGPSSHRQNPNAQFHHVRNSHHNPKPQKNNGPPNHHNRVPQHFKDHTPQHHNRIPPHHQNHGPPPQNHGPPPPNHQFHVSSSHEDHNSPHDNFVPLRESHTPHHGNHGPFHEQHNSQLHDIRRPLDHQNHQGNKFNHQDEEPSFHETRDPHNHQSFVSNFQHIDFPKKNPHKPNNNLNEFPEEEGDEYAPNFPEEGVSSQNSFNNDLSKFNSFEFTKNNDGHKQHSQEQGSNASPSFDTRHENTFHHPSQNLHHREPPKQFEASSTFPNRGHEGSFHPPKNRPNFQRPKPDLKHSRKPTVFSHRDLIKSPPTFSQNRDHGKIVGHRTRNPHPDKKPLAPKDNDNSHNNFFSPGKDFESHMKNLQFNQEKHRSEKDPNAVGVGFMFSSQGTEFKGSKSNPKDSSSHPKFTKLQSTPFPDFSQSKKPNSNTPFNDELYGQLYDNTFSTSQRQNHNSQSPHEIKESDDFHSFNLGTVTKPTESKPKGVRDQFEDLKKSNQRPPIFKPKVKKPTNIGFPDAEKESFSSAHSSFNSFSNERKVPTLNNVGAFENEFYQTGYESEAAELRKKAKKKFEKPEESSDGFSKVPKHNLESSGFNPSSERSIKKKEEIKPRNASRGKLGPRQSKSSPIKSNESQSHSSFYFNFSNNNENDENTEQFPKFDSKQATRSQKTFRRPETPNFAPKNGEWSKKEGMSRPIFNLRTQRLKKQTSSDTNE